MFNNTCNHENELISVIFTSTDNKIHYSMICKKSDDFKELEEKLYGAYPDYKETVNKFVVNGNTVDKNKNITENKINDHDIIILHIVR